MEIWDVRLNVFPLFLEGCNMQFWQPSRGWVRCLMTGKKILETLVGNRAFQGHAHVMVICFWIHILNGEKPKELKSGAPFQEQI